MRAIAGVGARHANRAWRAAGEGDRTSGGCATSAEHAARARWGHAAAGRGEVHIPRRRCGRPERVGHRRRQLLEPNYDRAGVQLTLVVVVRPFTVWLTLPDVLALKLLLPA
jgi:hypothetical protein